MKKTILMGCMALFLALVFCLPSYAQNDREKNPIANFFFGGGGSHQRSGASSGGSSSVPEPGTMVLLASGVASLLVANRLRKRK